MKLLFRPLVLLLALVLFGSACSSSTPIPTEPRATATSVPTSIPTATPTTSPIFRDDFSGALEVGWTWIREDGSLWSLTSKPDFLSFVLQANPMRNLLVRDVSSENFQITTRVLFTPESNFQFAGLLVYQDDGTIARFARIFCDLPNGCVGNGLYFEGSQGNTYVGPNLATETQSKDEAYLRISKTGSHFTASYSEDGEQWTVIGEHEFVMPDPKVGLMTGNSSVDGKEAYFDYFTLQEMP